MAMGKNYTVNIWNISFVLEDEEGHIVLNEDGSVKEFSADNVDYEHWANNINRWCKYYLPANNINPNKLKEIKKVVDNVF